MPGLGRRLSPDQRDARFQIRTMLEPTDRHYRYWWPSGSWQDQGSEGTCVGFAWAHYVEDGPVTHEGTVSGRQLYAEAVQHDVWVQNDGPDYHFGTSVRAGAKALQDRGLISEYRWAWDVETVAHAILTRGPVVVGTVWTIDMYGPDLEGFIHPAGSVVGGHAYVLNGVNVAEGKFRMKNSWGRRWGQDGYAWISYGAMKWLLEQDGEACLAVEVPSR